MPTSVSNYLAAFERILPFCTPFVWAFAALLIAQFGRRLVAGASVRQLFRDRFYECPPIQCVLWFGIAGLWVALFAAGITAIRSGALAFQHYERTHQIDSRLSSWTAGALASVVIFYIARKRFQRFITEFRPVPPQVAVEVRHISTGIPQRLVARLGVESFPNRISRTWKAGLWLRRVAAMILGGAAAYVLIVYAWEFFKLYDKPELQGWPVVHAASLATYPERLRPLLANLVPPLGIAIAGFLGLVLFFQLLFANRNYLLLKFHTHWLLLIGAGAFAWATILTFFGAHPAVIVSAGVFFLLTRRLCKDLALARRYEARQRVVSPMIDEVRRHCKFLASLPGEPSCEYPKLDREELGRRISRGAKNLEEAGPLVTRHFGRYLRLAEVRHERCAVATLRYLTVARGAILGNGWATTRSLFYPQVPVWDLQRFPLCPPDGYQSSNQRLDLGRDWNAVVNCGRCGGSGRITETETYQEPETRYETVYSNGQSQSVMRTVYVTKTRTVTRTCPSCGGTGRLEHVQLLQTHWRHLHSSATQPGFPMPELIEFAEEVTFFEMPYIEGMQLARTDEYASSVAPQLTQEMQKAGRALADVSDRHVPTVLQFLGGQHVYRADFSVHGFHTINISFGRLFGRDGWFFGKRPEFHFPRLPLSWSVLGTRMFMLPVFAWLIYWCLRGAVYVVLLP